MAVYTHVEVDTETGAIGNSGLAAGAMDSDMEHFLRFLRVGGSKFLSSSVLLLTVTLSLALAGVTVPFLALSAVSSFLTPQLVFKLCFPRLEDRQPLHTFPGFRLNVLTS